MTVAKRDLSVASKSRLSHPFASYAFVGVVMVVYLFPLAFLINTALKSNSNFFADPVGITTSFDWANFMDAWNQGNFGAFLLNSVLYTGIASAIGTLVSLLVGFPTSRGYFRNSKAWYGFFVVMLFLPNAVIAQFQLLLHLGLYDNRLGYILIMAAAVGIGPLLVSGYIRSVPIELDEAAALDGVGYWRFLFTFIVPSIRPVLATVFILQAIGVWNDIILATVVFSDPSKSPMTLGLFAFQGVYASQWGLLAAATMIVTAPLVLAFVFLQRYLVSDVLGGAFKG